MRIRIAGLVSGAVIALSAAGAAAQTITVVNQGGAPAEAQRVAVFEPFMKETGLKIVVDTYNQELAKIRAQVETKNLVWDAVSLNPINEAAGCEEGLLEKIDWKSHVDEKPFAAIGGFGKCGAPYLVSPGGLVYDADKYKGDSGPKSWVDFWDVQKFPGKRGMLYQPDQMLETALMADGVAPKDVPAVLAGPGGVDRAFKKLGEIKPHVKWWKSGDESMQLILSGEVDMVYAWQGRVNIANRTNKRNLKIVWPAGYTSALIYLGVMKGSPRKDDVVRLVKYQLTAETQARYAEIMGYPPANADAYPLLSAEKRDNLPGQYADRGMMQAGSLYINFWLDNGDSIRQRFATFVAQ
jgi:putative spermidine/putrescine transport system substrate-binding protein